MSSHLSLLFQSQLSTEVPSSEKLNVKNELQTKRASRKRLLKNVTVSTRSQFFGNGQFSNTGNNTSTSSVQQQQQQQQQQVSNDFVSSTLKFKIPNFSKLPPLELATEFVNGVNNRDDDIPALNEVFTKYQIDNYNFKPVTGLKNFTRFEKTAILNIPDEVLEAYSNTKCVTSMGIFPELNKSWLTVDNKLILWDYEDVTNANYSTIDEIKHTILCVKLVKPKKGVFVDNVNYLLLIATPMDIYILLIEYDSKSKKMDIYNTGMMVSTQGLIVNNFVSYSGTNDIFFTGLGDGINIWKLNYSNKQDWFTNKCSKECLTRSGISTILPDSLNGINLFHNNSTVPNPQSIKHEYITQLELDQSRAILYTLSSKSIVRAYKLKIDKQQNVTIPNEILKSPNDMLRDLSTTTLNLQSLLLQRKTVKILKIFPVSKLESNNLYLVVILNNGVRIFLNGASYAGFGSSTPSLARLTASFAKFPPPDFQFYEKIEKRMEEQKKLQLAAQTTPFNSVLTRDQLQQQQQQLVELYTPLELKAAQESSTLLSNLKFARVISPGIFFGITKTDTEDKLFVSTPDYGVLKKDKAYVEDFEFLDTSGIIHDIIPLTLDSPTNCNLFASQYTSEPLSVAVLTNQGIHIYKYRTPDLILEDSLDEITFKDFSLKYGSEESCSSMLYLSCKYGKPELFKTKATQFFIHGGKNGDINKNLTSVLDNVELSDRFFGTVMLVSRLFKRVWNKEVFALNSELIKFENNGYVNEQFLLQKMSSLKQQPLKGLNLQKQDIEYLLSSVLIICDFFDKNSSKIPGLSSRNSNFDISNDRNLDVILQAENMSFKSLLQFLENVKEALSFLIVLLEEFDTKAGFEEIFQYLSVQTQLDLSCLTLEEFLAPKNDYVKGLIKEILSAIMNKNISKGSSVEYITTSLQERCGNFCSSDDVIIYKAIENFKKSRELYGKDYEMSKKYLIMLINLFSKCNEQNLNFEIIQNCIDLMIEMKFYEESIEFLLNLSSKGSQQAKQTFYTETKEDTSHSRKIKLYDLVFKILTDIDTKAKTNVEYIKLCELSYLKCFNFKDKTFQFQLYKYLINTNNTEKLIEINSEFVLPFLEEYSSNDINIAYLLCNYHLKRFNYLELANVLVSITIAFEELDDETKVQLLCKAKVYLNAAESSNNSSKLSAAIDELINSLVF